MSKITRQFLEENKWLFESETVYTETFQHSVNPNLKCVLGEQEWFEISERDRGFGYLPSAQFSTRNPNLTQEDYHTIIKLLNVKI